MVDRRRDGDDIEIQLAQGLNVGGVGDARGGRELTFGHLARTIDAARQFINAAGVDVESHDRKMGREIDGER